MRRVELAGLDVLRAVAEGLIDMDHQAGGGLIDETAIDPHALSCRQIDPEEAHRSTGRCVESERVGQTWRMGAALALAASSGRVPAHDGTHQIEVRIARFAFDPAQVEIVAGDSVTWANADLAPHTATAEDGARDTSTLERGGRGCVTFDVPGEYPYFCAFHPHMTGMVTVHPKPGG